MSSRERRRSHGDVVRFDFTESGFETLVGLCIQARLGDGEPLPSPLRTGSLLAYADKTAAEILAANTSSVDEVQRMVTTAWRAPR